MSVSTMSPPPSPTASTAHARAHTPSGRLQALESAMASDVRPVSPEERRSMEAAAAAAEEARPAQEEARSDIMNRIAALFSKPDPAEAPTGPDLPASALDTLKETEPVASPFDGMTLPKLGDVATLVTIQQRCKHVAMKMKDHVQLLRERRDRRVAISKRAEARRRWRLIRTMAKGTCNPSDLKSTAS